MGLLDSVLGQVLGGGAQPSQGAPGGLGGMGDLAGALGGLLADNGGHGGLGGLVGKFEQAGLGHVIGSWIGSGDNAPISGNQLSQVLGNDVVAGLAQKLGVNVQTLLPMLATLLPTLIDRLTPQGQAPAQGLGAQDELLGALGRLLK